MAPSVIPVTVTSPTSADPKMGGLQSSRFASGASNSREATPTAVKPKAANADTEDASVFKSELTNIRNLVTCSICDQLLYEPWTLGCGHTYCYSCLCNWFVTNKRKKTCPECRTAVKQMPAPAFLVKQMVEIFCKRSELMRPDESIDQHDKKRAEEIADVDKDKNSPEGLFRGTFSIPPRVELIFDEADGVMRCPQCQHEHEGGRECTVCGTRFEMPYDGYGFSDDDDVDLDLELEDLEVELDEEFEADHFHHFLGGFGPPHHPAHHHHYHMHHHHHTESSDSDIDGDSEEDEEDDDNSLRDFVVRDEEPNQNRGLPNGRNDRQPITISDDESDEGGAVSNRRRRPNPNRGRATISSSPSAPSILTVTDSENSEINDEAEMLRDAGWSPLDTENESDADENVHYGYRRGTEDDRNSEDESDTNTMRNEESDDEDDRSREDMSETPTYGYDPTAFMVNESTPKSYASEDEDDYSGEEFPHAMDRDGDTEMSVSPDPSSRSVSVSTNIAFGYDMDGGGEIYVYEDQGTSRGNRGASVNTDNYGDMRESLGPANEIHEIEDDSSDSSIHPPPRRRERRYPVNPRVQQTDPRISMMFAEHQQSLRGAQSQQLDLDGFEVEVGRAEPNSRNRRMTAYRIQPSRRIDPLRNSRSPSATRIISSSSRVTRPPRQYQRRYH